MGTMLVIDKTRYEHVGTSLEMMKFIEFDVIHQVDYSSKFRNVVTKRIHLNMNI